MTILGTIIHDPPNQRWRIAFLQVTLGDLRDERVLVLLTESGSFLFFKTNKIIPPVICPEQEL